MSIKAGSVCKRALRTREVQSVAAGPRLLGTGAMRRVLLSWLCVALWAFTSGEVLAQITVTNSVFPAVGDTLHFAVDDHPGPEIVVTPPGFNQHWDFSSLQRSASWSEVMRPAATGTSAGLFPDATLVYTQTGPTRFPILLGSNGAEAYLKATGSEVTVLGFDGGSDILGLGRQEVTRYSPAMNVATAPTSIFDIRQFSTNVIEEVSAEPIPGVVNLPFSNIAAFRLRVAFSQTALVDAFGTLTIPGGTFDVLREKRSTYAVVDVDALVPPLGWINVLNEFLASDLEPKVGVFDQTSYRFLDAQSKEEIAILQGPVERNLCSGCFDSLTIASVQFKDLAASVVPESETYAMMLAGLALLGAMAKRRKSKQR